MGKIVGSLLSFIFCFSLQATLSLHLTDMHGMQIKEIGVGEPFLLTVSSKDAQASELHIEGVQDFYVRRVGQRMMSINGDASIEYTYQIRIDKIGTYQLGPAINSQTNQRSNSVRIKVYSAAPKGKKEAQTKAPNKSDNVLLRLWCDKDQAYVNQEIKVILRFYFPQEQEISVEHVVAQDPSSVTIQEKSGPKKGLQEIEGKQYTFYEWQWSMFAQQAGDLVIPAYMLEYAKHLSTDNFMGGWAAFFSPRYDRKRIYSNALTIHIDPLPETTQPVHAVGHFTHYTAQLQPAMAKQYEGMVLKLTVDGSGNTDTMQIPDLVLPEGFTWYASKQYTQPLQGNKRTTFEYIVQGLHPNDTQIPEQTFTFFDVASRTYKELKTAPLFVSIVPAQAVNVATQCQAEISKTAENSHDVHLKPLAQQYLQSEQLPMLPSHWFMILVLIPLSIYILYLAYVLAAVHLPYLIPGYAQRYAYVQAKKTLDRVCAQNDVQALHALFLQYVTRVRKAQQIHQSTYDIFQIIHNSMLPDERKKEAVQFFEKIIEAAYVQANHYDYTLCQQAKQWLDELKGIL